MFEKSHHTFLDFGCSPPANVIYLATQQVDHGISGISSALHSIASSYASLTLIGPICACHALGPSHWLGMTPARTLAHTTLYILQFLQ